MIIPGTPVEGGGGSRAPRSSTKLRDLGKILPVTEDNEAWIGWILRAPESSYQYAGRHTVPQNDAGDKEIRPLRLRG